MCANAQREIEKETAAVSRQAQLDPGVPDVAQIAMGS